jgi:hypothetical protein
MGGGQERESTNTQLKRKTRPYPRRTASRLKRRRRPPPPRTCLPSPPPRVSTPCAHPKPLHHGKLTPKRSEPSRCVIASSWSKSCPRASLPGLHDSNGMKPYICFCTRGYPCLRANTHTHTRVPGWQEVPWGLENRHHLAHPALSCACLALCSLPSPSIIPRCDAPLRASPAMSMAAGAHVRVRACAGA